jgi:geranylgeranylglycerol-phosphate geranylgeranyltransferase
MGRAKEVRRILSYVKLTRPQNNLIAALSVLVGATISAHVDFWDKVSLACLSAFLISAGGNSINDFFDVKIDRINKPYRPLPRGEISLSSALVFSIALFLSGIALSLWIKPANIGVAGLACGLLIIYSSILKKRFLWGNLTVSLVSALAFVYGGMVTDDFRLSLIPAAFAFLFHLGREILKDLEDRDGDFSSGASTLPIVLGASLSLGICTLVFIALIALTLFPYLFDIFSSAYLVLVLGVDLVLVYVMWSMWGDRSPENLHRLSNILKADMLLGIAAIFMGKF